MQMTHCGIVVLCGLFSNLFTNFVPSVILKRRQDVAISRLVVLQAFGGGNRMKGELPMAHTEEDRRTYDAFISYKHVPYVSKVAHAVLRRLEHYRPPKGSGAQKKRLYLCIDDQNLETAGDLNKQLHEALDHSEYLIYLACPETFNSIYCRDEIRYFKKLHDGRLDNIIVLLLQGKPEDVLPQELCYEGCLESGEMPDPDRQAEVHWLDLRAGSTVKAIKKLNESLLMIAAPLLHCKPDELIQRERQWKKQKCMMWGMLCVVVLAASLSVAYTLWLTWTMDYRRDAEVAMADDDDNKALFYYAKILSMNPFDEEARINAQILLQKKAWPMIIEEEKDSAILGNHVYPVYPADMSTELNDSLQPICATVEGNIVLWREGKERYYYGDAEGNVLEELSDVGLYRYPGGQTAMNAWEFSKAEEPHYTFCWPEDGRIEKLDWSENFSDEWHANVWALRPGVIVINDYEALTFYQLEDGLCRELCRMELSEIFKDDQSILDKYNISLVENYSFDMWPSPNGSRLIVSANFWGNYGMESVCHSEAALIDTDTYSLFGVMKSQECLISDVIFQDDSQKLALIYNNESGVLENCGYAAVYDCSGNLVFQTNCSGDMIPQRGCFCGDVFLLYCFPTTYFLDAGTGKPIGEPLLAGMDHAFLTDDGQIALECSGNVRYCRLVQYSGGIVEKNRVKDIQVALLNEREMRYRIADHLWLYSSYGGGEIYLQNNKGITLDRFPIRNKEKGNMVLKLSYGESAQTAFVLDDERNLYCIPIDMELEKFVPSEKISVYAGILDFSPAKDGVCYLDNYYPGYYFSEISDLNYITNDTSLFYHDPAVHYMEWVADPHINNSFIGMMSGESDYDYAVIVTRTEGQFNLGFFSMKTGTFLTDMSLEAADDLFVSFGENNDFIIHSGGSWRSMWLGNDRPDGNAIKQLMDISGYKLSGSRFKNDQKLVYARTVMAPNSVLSWSQYLEWEFVPFQEAGRGIE